MNASENAGAAGQFAFSAGRGRPVHETGAASSGESIVSDRGQGAIAQPNNLFTLSVRRTFRTIPPPRFPGDDLTALSHITVARGEELPHWTLSNVVYHVCFRLADSLPTEPIDEQGSIADVLDSGHGACLLRRTEIAQVVLQTIAHDVGRKFALHAVGIMPNHVHILLQMATDCELCQTVQAIKSVSAHKIKRLVEVEGPVWQSDYYNHILRARQEYDLQSRYVGFTNAGVFGWRRTSVGHGVSAWDGPSLVRLAECFVSSAGRGRPVHETGVTSSGESIVSDRGQGASPCRMYASENAGAAGQFSFSAGRGRPVHETGAVSSGESIVSDCWPGASPCRSSASEIAGVEGPFSFSAGRGRPVHEVRAACRCDDSKEILYAVDALLRGLAGESFTLRARAVVLATGGWCGRYDFSTNPPYLRGDGIRLAEALGAEILDRDSVQYEPTVALEPAPLRGVPVITTLLFEGATFRNAAGEEFLTDCRLNKDELSRAIRAEIAAGRGVRGGVWYDVTRVPRTLLETRYAPLVRRYAEVGVDVTRDWLLVAPAPHTSLGGVRIDPSCRVLDKAGRPIPGLFAAGEVTGGVHGANRLGGNAGTEVLVFGRIAGRSAAEFTKGENRK